MIRVPRRFVAVVCLALVAVTLQASSSRAAEILPTRLAVMEFAADATEANSQRGGLLSELVMSELLATGDYVLVERLQLEQATRELNLQGTGQFDPATAAAIGRRVGAQVVVIGTLSEGAEAFVVGRFVDVELGTVRLSKTIEIESGSLLRAARDLAAAFRDSDNKAAAEMLANAQRQAALGQSQSALELYEAITAKHPRSEAADDALLALAQASLKAGEYFDAAQRAECLLESFADSPLTEEGLMVLASAKYFTVFGDPDRPADPSIFLNAWLQKQSGQQTGTARERMSLKVRIAQEAKQKYELLLELFPDTRHRQVVSERLAKIAKHGGQ